MTLTVNNLLLFKNYPTEKFAYKHLQTVQNKSIHNSRGPNYNLKFNEDDLYKHLSVSETEYNSLNIGDTVVFNLRKGILGYDVFKGYKIKTKHNNL